MSETNSPAYCGRSVAVALLLVVSAAVAGCSLAGGQASPLPDGEGASERADGLAGLQFTQNTTLYHDGTVGWTVQRISSRPGTGDFRNEVRSNGPPPADANQSLPAGSRIVSNGSVRYIYRADSGRVFRSEVRDRPRDRTVELRRLFAALHDEAAGPIRHPTPGVSALPVVPVGESTADDESVRWRDGRVTVSYNGTATVSGRRAYVVDLQSATDNSSFVESTLWLDTQFLYPIQRHRVIERNGDRYEYRSVARNVTFNPEFPDGTFEFDPDSLRTDPTVVESASYDSRAEMVDDLDWHVPDPAVPEGFAFDGGYYTSDDPGYLSLTYVDGTGGSVRVSVFDDHGNLTGGRQTSLDGRPATLGQFDGRRYLTWNADDRQYSVSGTVENATLRRVAESVAD
jgi:outer membrane lipoprotein-sorting protein